MSVIQWAKTVSCDWPGCKSVGEVTLAPDMVTTIMPAGWLSFRGYIVRFDGSSALSEVCSIHASATLAQAHKLQYERASDGD